MSKSEEHLKQILEEERLIEEESKMICDEKLEDIQGMIDEKHYPAENHKYCFVCVREYKNYKDHIEQPKHIMNFQNQKPYLDEIDNLSFALDQEFQKSIGYKLNRDPSHPERMYKKGYDKGAEERKVFKQPFSKRVLF